MTDNSTPTPADVIEGMREALQHIIITWDAAPRLIDTFLDTNLSKAIEASRAALALPDSKPDNQGGT